MKNEYAYNSQTEIIHISEIQHTKNSQYTCLNCGSILIPKKGKIRSHHFSHKHETNCSYESYLHKLGKMKFYNEFKRCLSEKKPFYIDYTIDKTCNSCFKSFGISCKLDSEIKSYDLTKTFDNIFLEKSFNGFVADILLKSSKTNDVLFVEFAVTHKCEEEKIKSGNRIIEIDLQNDSDLNFIGEKHISIKDLRNKFYNFKTKHLSENFINAVDCKELFDFYLIHKNNKTVIVLEQMRNIINEVNNETVMFYKIRELENRKFDFEDFVINYSFSNKEYKNCFACRFFDENNSYYSSTKYFCKRLRKGIDNSNYGSNCEKFWRRENRAEL